MSLYTAPLLLMKKGLGFWDLCKATKYEHLQQL